MKIHTTSRRNRLIFPMGATLVQSKIDRILPLLKKGYILKKEVGYIIPDMGSYLTIHEEVMKEMVWRELIVRVGDNRWELKTFAGTGGAV